MPKTQRRPAARKRPRTESSRVYNAHPDTLDFRDRMYEPSLAAVRLPAVPLSDWQKLRLPVLDQGPDGACTGFALATVVHFLLRTQDQGPAKRDEVSPWMLYRMARRYDEWPGESYSGSSARGAMKGWHKHGVCKLTLWRGDAQQLTQKITADASARPLGAYLRVNHKDLVAMHCALTDVGALYATATVHSGWDEPAADGTIGRSDRVLGGHAFVIVGYDSKGLWIQNSWGPGWGKRGCARIGYDDWLANGNDVWVARLGVAIELEETHVAAMSSSRVAVLRTGEPSFNRLRPHIVSIGNDGELRERGTFGNSAADLREIVTKDLPRRIAGWRRPRVLLYAHGGLVSEDGAIQRVSDYLDPLLAAEVYPLAFVWKTDYWTTLTNILRDALQKRRPEGILDAAKDFMLDRLDDALEPIARVLTGKAEWSEMKENALLATKDRSGGVRQTVDLLVEALAQIEGAEIHVAAHSAGSILMGPVAQLLATKGKIAGGTLAGEQGHGVGIGTCTLWAPACTIELWKSHYLPALRAGGIGELALYTLNDTSERDDDCANVYHKSLLYLVSNAFEDRARIPLFRDGEPILGMQKFIEADKELKALIAQGKIEWVLSPNGEPLGSKSAAGSTSHGGFDDDEKTVRGTLERIANSTADKASFRFCSSPSRRRETRASLDERRPV